MRDLTQPEVGVLTSARNLLEELEKDLRHSSVRYDGFLAAKADTAADAVWDFLNCKAVYQNDEQARLGVEPLTRSRT